MNPQKRIDWRMAAVLVLATATSGRSVPELIVKDNIGRAWADEPIEWTVSPQAGQWDGTHLVVMQDGAAIPAQASVAERFADNSVKSACVSFIVRQLASNASTRITAEFDRDGPGAADLAIRKEAGTLVLGNRFAAVRLLNRNADTPGEFSPILGVRLPSGKWTGSGEYATESAKPISTRTLVLEEGPVRLRAKITTTFDNGRRHEVTVSLLSGSRVIDIEEAFDIGPDTMYRMKTYQNDRDELAWEWWSWYGDADGLKEVHPNNWVFRISGPDFTPTAAHYSGEASTDADKGEKSARGLSGYTLTYAREQRLEKYLSAECNWRPDGVRWYVASSSTETNADAVGLLGHSMGKWRNPDVLPHDQTISLRVSANDLRVWSYAKDRTLAVQCPIGLGRRAWGIRVSTRQEMLAPQDLAPQAITADRVQRDLGLDTTRQWVTDWPSSQTYPRLFAKPNQREALLARTKGAGLGMNGQLADTYFKNQDEVSFAAYYQQIADLADADILGYFSGGAGMSGVYPGWMMGYWNGITVTCGLDSLGASPLCSAEKATALRRKLAILTYALVSRNNWPDKQVNYGWGSMNMPVGRWGGLSVMATAISDHPMAAAWLRDTTRYYRMNLETEFDAWGTHGSCPHYISSGELTALYAMIALANSGQAEEDISKHPRIRAFARYYLQLMTPIDPRYGIRLLLSEGDGRPGSSSLPAILATLFKHSDPQLSGELMTVWKQGGEPRTSGMGVPDGLIIDPSITATPLQLPSQVFPGFGAMLRYRSLGTPEEAYLCLIGGNFMIDHGNTDAMAFHWHEKGVPLSVFNGSMYQPFAYSAISHNTLCWDYEPEGGPTPGKDKPGDWYHDKGYPFVDGVNRPRLHWEVTNAEQTQSMIARRGLITLAGELPGAALLEGKVEVRALAQVPTRADYSVPMVAQIWPKGEPTTAFDWRRRLLYVKAPTAAGMNYLVIRDDTGTYADKTPSFNYWALAESVELADGAAHFKGALGVDTDLHVVSPSKTKLFTDTFVNTQCEPDVSVLHQAKHDKLFSEQYVLSRAEGQKGCGFLVVVFPRRADEPRPAVEPWLGGQGVKVAWKGETHFVLLDTAEQVIDADGIVGKASTVVVKIADKDTYSISLPVGGEARFRGQTPKGAAPVEVTVAKGKAKRVNGTDLMRGPHPPQLTHPTAQ